MRAVRLKCLDCCCGDAKTVRECPIPDCPLYEFRSGRDPTASRVSKGRGKKKVEEVKGKEQ